MKRTPILLFPVLSLAAFPAISASADETPPPKVLVGHVCAISPTGMAMVFNERAVFVIEPQYSDRPQDDAQVAPGTTAPDGSYLKTNFTRREPG